MRVYPKEILREPIAIFRPPPPDDGLAPPAIPGCQVEVYNVFTWVAITYLVALLVPPTGSSQYGPTLESWGLRAMFLLKMYFVGFQGFHGFPWFSISRLPMVLHGLLCGTLGSWLHWISTIIRILSPGLENNNTLKWCYGNFPTKQHSSGLLEKYQNNILMHCCPPTQGTRSRYLLKVGDKIHSNVDLVIFQQSWHISSS